MEEVVVVVVVVTAGGSATRRSLLPGSRQGAIVRALCFALAVKR